ncbi:MAG: HAD family phosphatase [Candidatus Moranbacteria bacterium]|nr:HAD family phosphatase [Candidatus Moranbacteria bacterium]
MVKQRRKLAVFDIDGTIFRKNLHFELLDELSWRGIFGKESRKVLVRAYASWLEHRGTYEDYRKKIVGIYEKEIKGRRQEDIIDASRKVAEFNKDRVYIFARDLIKKLRAQKYIIIAVSGSPIEIVDEYNKYLKLDEVFGSTYETDGKGKYTGKAIFEPVRHKGHLVGQYISEKGLTLEGSVGVGDTESDISFLEMVKQPIAFNPNLNLEKVARRRKWKIIVEKKDVIYDIGSFKIINF